MYKITINLSFIVKLFFLLLISTAPLLDNMLLSSYGIANYSSPRLKTFPIFVCFVNFLVILFFFYKSNKIKLHKSDAAWISLTLILIISNFFSISSYEDKLSLLLVIISSVLVALYLSVNKDDGFESFLFLIIIFSFIALSIFFMRLSTYGSVAIARGGLNIYTISGIISWLLLLAAFLYPLREIKRFKRILYLINIIVTFISLLTANRMGLIASMLVWIVLFIKYNKGFLISLGIVLLYMTPLVIEYISKLYIFTRFGGYNLDSDFFYEIFMSSRGNIWLDSWTQWLELYSVFGTGLGSFHYLIIDGVNLDSAHNFFLNILVEHGLVGAILIFFLILLIFKKSFINAFYFISIFFIFLFLSGWTIVQPVGFISALNLIIIILYARSKLPDLLETQE